MRSIYRSDLNQVGDPRRGSRRGGWVARSDAYRRGCRFGAIGGSSVLCPRRASAKRMRRWDRGKRGQGSVQTFAIIVRLDIAHFLVAGMHETDREPGETCGARSKCVATATGLRHCCCGSSHTRTARPRPPAGGVGGGP